MIIATFVYLCDVCGKIESESGDAGEYEETTMYYPDGWIDVYDTDGDNFKGHCPECAKEHADEFTMDKNWDGWAHYKKETLTKR